MKEIIYNQSSALIIAGLLAGMLFAMEIGYRSAGRKRAIAKESVRSQVNSVLASMLGLLALLLGFTFSLALQRYEDRSRAIVAEANAIGTTYLRSQLLPAEMQDEVKTLLGMYLDNRAHEGHVKLSNTEKRAALLDEGDRITFELWAQAIRAATLDPRPVTSGLYIESLNGLIDASGTRNAALDRHVPEIVILLMFATCFMTTATLGYASGVAGHRVSPPGIVLVMLIAFVIYLIIDLDRPRRGSIQVSQESLFKLQQSLIKPH